MEAQIVVVCAVLVMIMLPFIIKEQAMLRMRWALVVKGQMLLFILWLFVLLLFKILLHLIIKEQMMLRWALEVVGRWHQQLRRADASQPRCTKRIRFHTERGWTAEVYGLLYSTLLSGWTVNDIWVNRNPTLIPGHSHIQFAFQSQICGRDEDMFNCRVCLETEK